MLGRDAVEQFQTNGPEMDIEKPCPAVTPECFAEQGALVTESFEQVQSIDAQSSVLDDDAMYEDTQYENEAELDN